MTARYLLETNVLSQPLREPQGSVAARIALVGESNVFTSIIVACKLRFRAAKRGSAALSERVDGLLASIEVAPLDEGVDRRYAEVRFELERQGQPIGGNDLLIAAHALHQEATLVTDNTAEFQRVAGLNLENWMRPR
jgi:tRNA(fMet)-specific endonuclease VapC